MLLFWDRYDDAEAVVIDTSPDSRSDAGQDRYDSVLRVGEEFYDEVDGIKIETIGIGREGTQPYVFDYVDVRITRLEPRDTTPPLATVGEAIEFS